jgi:hypothetical protein
LTTNVVVDNVDDVAAYQPITSSEAARLLSFRREQKRHERLARLAWLEGEVIRLQLALAAAEQKLADKEKP